MFSTDLFDSEFIPSARASRKLMIVLHGKGDSTKPFRRFNEEVGVEPMNYLLLNAPRKYQTGFSWYGDPPFQNGAVPRIREKLRQVMDELESQGWNPKDIYIFGFSQGCLVGSDFVLHDHRSYAGFIGVSGYFHFYPGWRRELATRKHKTPWMLMHGSRDKVLPIEDTKFGVRKIQSLGVKVEWNESTKAHSMDQDEADLIRDWLKRKLKVPAPVSGRRVFKKMK